MGDSAVDNLLRVAERQGERELFADILVRPGCRIERIVSFGQVTPADQPFLQEWDEWVLLLGGAARVALAGREVALAPGDHLLIPAGIAHRVTFTDPDVPTIWLAVHCR